jgi:hypothetical protein
MNYCVECGSRLQAQAKFCVNCGMRISVEQTSIYKESSRSTPSKLSSLKSEDGIGNLIAQVSTRIKPVYGKGFKKSEHCFNCGAENSSAKRCKTCDASWS